MRILSLDNADCKDAFGKLEALRLLVDACTVESLKQDALKTLAHISDTHTGDTLAAVGGIPALLAAMELHHDPDAQVNGARLLHGIILGRDTQKKAAIGAGAIATLEACLGSQSLRVRDHAAVIVQSLSVRDCGESSKDIKALFGGCVVPLVAMVERGEQSGVKALRNVLSKSSENKALAIKAGAVAVLLAYCKSCKPPAGIPAALQALCNMADNADQKTSILRQGLLQQLIDLIEMRSDEASWVCDARGHEAGVEGRTLEHINKFVDTVCTEGLKQQACRLGAVQALENVYSAPSASAAEKISARDAVLHLQGGVPIDTQDNMEDAWSSFLEAAESSTTSLSRLTEELSVDMQTAAGHVLASAKVATEHPESWCT